MIVYVATAYPNRAEASAVMIALRQAGHEISHDWTDRALDPAWPAEKQGAYLRQCGDEDLQGVLTADVLVLVNDDRCRDAMAEFGVALGRDIPVFVLGTQRRGSVFFHRTCPVNGVSDLITRLKQLEASL